ncbi:MAG: enoyl-CoA hydratase/isomerase family protein [Promethearchaeota archaeon]
MAERKGRVLELTIERPRRGNSLDPPTIVQLREQFLEAQGDPRVRVILLTGSGERDFCTGMDVNAAMHLTPGGKVNLANTAGDVATLIYQGKPTVVAVNGRAMGMGVVFAVAADYRLAVGGSVMQMPEVKSGIFPGASCIALMTRVCGVAWTRKILMSGLQFPVERLERANIVDEMVTRDQFEARKGKVTRLLGRMNPVLLRAIKFTTTRAVELDYASVVRLETEMADWYSWDDPSGEFKRASNEFSCKFPLTGKPELLLEDYESPGKS